MSNTQELIKKISTESTDLFVKLYCSFDELERYGNWDKATKNFQYFVPSLLCGSDYSGGYITRSNFESFSKTFDSGLDIWYKQVYGGYRTYAIVIDLANIPEDVEDELVDFLNQLQVYPSIDDDRLSNLEQEGITEAWTSWASREFLQGIEKRFDTDLVEVKDEVLRAVFEDVAERINEYWECEGNEPYMYIRIKKVVEAMTQDDINKLK
jgi:hypothetical protein